MLTVADLFADAGGSGSDHPISCGWKRDIEDIREVRGL